MFILKNKIYYHDTDTGGIVYYAKYLEHLEEARSEYCHSKGVDLVKLTKEGILFPVVHLEIDYKSPAKYGDIIEIGTSVEKIGNASINLDQEIKRGNDLLLKAKTIWACVDAALRPRRIPEEIKQRLIS